MEIILYMIWAILCGIIGVAVYRMGVEEGRHQALEMSVEVIENIVDKFKELQECTAAENEE